MTSQHNHSPSGIYAFAECDVVNLQESVLLLDRHSDAQLLVTRPLAESMQNLGEFRSLESHTDWLTSSYQELAGQHADVMNILGALREKGLLVSAESACDRLNSEVKAAVDLPATRVFITTCDRPAAVSRLLESMLRAGGLSRHETLFLIDDSRDSDNAAANRDAVEQFNLSSPRDMQYFGAEEARKLMQSLIAQLPEREAAIRFLIDRDLWRKEKTHGLARNLSLLLSIGRRAIILDDDVLCTAIASPHRQPGLQFGQVSREIDFYQNDADMMSRNVQADFDPLTGHASCLGLNLGQAIHKLKGSEVLPADLVGASSRYLSLWGAESRVLVTQSGTLGDPGTSGTQWLFSIPGASQKRLEAFSGGIEGALSSRRYWLGQTRPMFTKMSIMSQAIGLDNTALLPPYFPVFRGEDYTFGAMTEYLHPTSAVLEYDWCVPHLPIESRSGNPAPEPESGRGMFNINKMITDRTSYLPGIPPENRLKTLAAYAAELSHGSDRGLISMYRKEVAEIQQQELARLNTLLQDGRIRPPLWQHWLENSVQNISAAMNTTAAITDMASLPAGLQESEVLVLFRRHVGDFSDALFAWEAIREAAAEVTHSLFEDGTIAV
jgi:hypothetical protein